MAFFLLFLHSFPLWRWLLLCLPSFWRLHATFHIQSFSKARTKFDTFQLQQLEFLFKITKYPDARLCEELAHRLKLDDATVQVMQCFL